MTMIDTSNVPAVKNIFTDPRFNRVKNAIYGFRGEVDGNRIGAVIATKSQRFADSNNHVLNKLDLEKLMTALVENRLDVGFVVTAATDANGNLVFIDMMESRKLVAEILARREPMSGNLGEFYLIAPHFRGVLR
jgi:hypothetical protein